MSGPSPIVLFPDPAVRDFMSHIAWFPLSNPFEPSWAQREQALLFDTELPEDRAPGAALTRISKEIQRQVADAAAKLKEGNVAGPDELGIYRGAAIYALWDAFRAQIQQIISDDTAEIPFLSDYVAAYKRLLLDMPVLRVPEPGHLLALMYQWRRTAFYIATKIRGQSPSAAAARAAIYRASMGANACTYARGLYQTIDEIPVLITGETGTGKELAAECIGWSRYIPLDEKHGRFVAGHRDAWHTRNICEVPRELIESALFGHKRGSFTGATNDAAGLFAQPEAYGTLFLDEIGEIPEHIQVKLLRPLEAREIVAVGDTKKRPIRGRHIFATNKDLEAKVRAGEFRADLLERMNGVRIHMPPLRAMLEEDPAEIARFVREFVARKLRDDEQVSVWTLRIVRCIMKELPGHAWTRNLRELKRFTERYLVSDDSMPRSEDAIARRPALTAPAPLVKAPAPAAAAEPAPAAAAERAAVAEPAATAEPAPPGTAVRAPESVCAPSSGLLGPNAKRGDVSAEELTRAFVTEVYLSTDKNVSETSRRTGLTRVTVRRMIDYSRLNRRRGRR